VEFGNRIAGKHLKVAEFLERKVRIRVWGGKIGSMRRKMRK